MSTIILGSSGFLGPQILTKYQNIISVGRNAPPGVEGIRHVNCPSLNHLPDVLDNVEFDKVIMMIGSSNHTALNKQVPLNVEAIEKNVLPLKTVFSYLRTRNLKKVLSFSSILLYDREVMQLPVVEETPLKPYQNDYIFSKYLGEEVAKFHSDVPNIVIRLTNIYGPTTVLGRPDLVNELVEGLLFDKKAKVKTNKPQRDFIFTEDAADAIVKLLETDYTGPVNVASGVMHSVEDIVSTLEELTGISIERGNGEHTGHLEFVADISKLKKLTGFEPRFDLKSGLKKTLDMMRVMYADKC